MNTFVLEGVPVSLLSSSKLLETCIDQVANDQRGLRVHFLNSYTLALATNDSNLLEVYRTANVCAPDGMPVVWLVKFAGGNLRRRVIGPDFMEYALRNCPSLRHYFFGGKEGSLKILLREIRAAVPNINVCGFFEPPHIEDSLEEFEKYTAEICKAKPDFVWIGIGGSKQDRFAKFLHERTGANVLAVGAAFDFISGTVKRAPKVLRCLGMEWMYRLLSEPRRLFPRYVIALIGLARVFAKLIANRVRT